MTWKKILAQGFSSASELLEFLELPLELGSPLAEQQFASRIPLGFAKRMQKGNPQDPLLLQALAVGAELEWAAGYDLDPLDEESSTNLKGLLHKYYGRVLVTLTGVCAINCRYCFRRHFPYQENNPGRVGLKGICEYISSDPSISEVILSGGDPLLASNAVLRELIQELESIPHLHTLRFHSRIPIVLPERLDKEFLEILKACALKKVMVLHCNHKQELNDEVKQICEDLHRAGCHLLNQSVLLAGINDNAQVLADLSQALFQFGVLPYYLHLLDKVQSVAHFDLPLANAQNIYKQLQTMLPGYLLPRMVREEAGKPSKTVIV